MATIFGDPHTLPPGFEDQSVYRFVLEEAECIEVAPASAPSSGPAASRMEALMALPGAEALEPRRFRPNLFVTRERQGGTLAEAASARRQALLGSFPGARVLSEEERTLAGQPALAALVLAPLDDPPLELVQWQVVTLREGYLYGFFATTARSHWERHHPLFGALVDAWS